jgi:excisionase family DNA binding protein
MTDHDLARKHWSVTNLAQHWNVRPATVRKLIRCGSLRAHRVGRSLRICPEEVERYERDQRVEALE